MRRILVWSTATVAAVVTFLVITSGSGGASEGWARYSNDEIGYSLDYPNHLEPMGSRDDVFFRGPGPIPLLGRFMGAVPVVIRWVDESLGNRGGTWVGLEPAGDTTLAGIDGQKYIYHHRDMFSVTRTVAYVIPHRGRSLGLEFRTGRDLTADQMRVLASFALE